MSHNVSSATNEVRFFDADFSAVGGQSDFTLESSNLLKISILVVDGNILTPKLRTHLPNMDNDILFGCDNLPLKI